MKPKNAQHAPPFQDKYIEGPERGPRLTILVGPTAFQRLSVKKIA